MKTWHDLLRDEEEFLGFLHNSGIESWEGWEKIKSLDYGMIAVGVVCLIFSYWILPFIIMSILIPLGAYGLWNSIQYQYQFHYDNLDSVARSLERRETILQMILEESEGEEWKG